MRTVLSALILVACLSSAGAFAQPPKPPAQSRPAPAAQPAKPAAPKPAPLPGGMSPDEAGGMAANIRLDVTVTDQSGEAAPIPKVVTVLLADRAFARTRSPFEDRSIAVDAKPIILDGRIRLSVTIESHTSLPPVMQFPGEKTSTSTQDAIRAQELLNWKNSFALLLDSGKPVVAFESSDAATKKKVSVEVKATILK